MYKYSRHPRKKTNLGHHRERPPFRFSKNEDVSLSVSLTHTQRHAPRPPPTTTTQKYHTHTRTSWWSRCQTDADHVSSFPRLQFGAFPHTRVPAILILQLQQLMFSVFTYIVCRCRLAFFIVQSGKGRSSRCTVCYRQHRSITQSLSFSGLFVSFVVPRLKPRQTQMGESETGGALLEMQYYTKWWLGRDCIFMNEGSRTELTHLSPGARPFWVFSLSFLLLLSFLLFVC